MDGKKPKEEYLKLGRWKPGQSGNPHGRPKGTVSLTKTLRDLLEKEINLNVHPITGELNVKLTVREIMILAMMKKALKGDMTAIQTVFERVDGKVPLPMEHKGITVQLAAMIEYIQDPAKLVESLNAETLENTETLKSE
jgi:hypothetical protein